MTAAVHHLADLPALAAHPSVTVAYGMDLELGHCELCVQTSYVTDDDVPPGKLRVTWRFGPGKPEHSTDVCSVACAEDELAQLIGWKGTCDITLHLPQENLPSGTVWTLPSAADEDTEFLLYDSLRRLFKTMPNTATVDMSGRDGFEHARNAVLAHISQLGLNRIEQLGRAS